MDKEIIFIDWNKTLSRDNYWDSLHNQYVNDSNIGELIEDLLFKENRSIIYDWMRGKVSSERVNDFLSNNLNLDYPKLWETFVNDCRYKMRIHNKLYKHLLLLKQHYTVILVTGNMDCFDRFTVPAQKLHVLFDSIYNSYNSGLLKTDNNGEIFKMILAEQDAPNFSNSFLIDDCLKTCDVFSKLGGTPINVKSVSDTRKALEMLIGKANKKEIQISLYS